MATHTASDKVIEKAMTIPQKKRAEHPWQRADQEKVQGRALAPQLHWQVGAQIRIPVIADTVHADDQGGQQEVLPQGMRPLHDTAVHIGTQSPVLCHPQQVGGEFFRGDFCRTIMKEASVTLVRKDTEGPLDYRFKDTDDGMQLPVLWLDFRGAI